MIVVRTETDLRFALLVGRPFCTEGFDVDPEWDRP